VRTINVQRGAIELTRRAIQRLAIVLLGLCAIASAQLTNVAVTAMTPTSATVSWTSVAPSSTQVYFGLNGHLNSYTPLNPALVTSHTATLTGLIVPSPGSIISYAAVSVDGSGNKLTSPTQQFVLCSSGQSGMVQTSGTINNYYEYGGMTLTWTNQSGQSITPTVCGTPIPTTITKSLDGGGSFSAPVPDSLQIVPSPSQWTATANSVGGIGVFSIAPVTITGPSFNLSAPLQVGAIGQTIHVWWDAATNTFYPPLPGTGSVTSVGLGVPGGFQVSGSPVSGAGILTWGLPVGWGTGSLLVGNGANSATVLQPGSSGTCIVSNGTGVAPTYQTCGTGTITGPTTGGGLVLTGSTLGNQICGTGQVQSYNGTAWVCSGAGNVSTSTVVSQNIVQPPGTQFSANNVDGIRYVDLSPGTFNWSQTISVALTANTPATVTITPCPLGIWGTDTTSYIKLSNGSTTEYDPLTGSGTCTAGATSGTIKFTPQNTFTATSIGSATAGIQEALNDASGQASAGSRRGNYALKFQPTNPPATTYYQINAPITVPVGIADIDASGASFDCESTQGACWYFTAGEILFHGARVGTKNQIVAAAITATACASNVRTYTTTLNPPVGSVVDVQGTDLPQYWGRYRVATTSSTSFTATVIPTGAAATCSNQSTTATPGGVAIDKTFIETNADNGLHVSDIYYDLPGWDPGYLLTSLIVVDNDQDFRADRVYTSFDGSSPNSCTAIYCPQVFYAPGGTAGNPLGSIHKSNLSVSGAANGVKWLAGETISIGDATIIQGAPQYSVMAGQMRGGSGGVATSGLYNEIGGAFNPLYVAAGLTTAQSQAEAGVNVVGGFLDLHTQVGGFSPGITGSLPTFATGGSTLYLYSAVICDGTNCTLPLPFGQAAPASSASYTIAWPHYGSQTGSTVTYWILKTSGIGGIFNFPFPYGTGNWSIASSAFAQCSGLICTTTDSTSTTLQPYTVLSFPTLIPYLPGWPGSVVLGNGATMYSDSGVPSSVVVTSNNSPAVYATRLDQLTPGVYASSLSNTTLVSGPGGTTFSTGGTMLQNGVNSSNGNGSMAPNLKGRLIFEPNSSLTDPLNSTHVITINDSNPAKTLADPSHRPVNDVNDVYIGLDQGAAATNAQAGLSFGAPMAISNYIGNVGDGVSWGERLTATSKTFQVAQTNVLGKLYVNGITIGPAFPIQLVPPSTDLFTGSGGLGGNWTIFCGTWTKASGQATATATCSNSYTAAAYTGGGTVAANQFSSVKLAAFNTPGSLMGAAVRVSTSAETYDACLALGGGSVLQEMVAGTGTNIGTPSSGPAVPIGDTLETVVLGNQLTCYDNGVPIITGTSSISSGYPGIAGGDNVGFVSNFQGGPLNYDVNGTLIFPAYASAGYQCAHFDPTGTLLPTGSDCGSGGGGGGVTSVAMTVPSWLSVAGSPIVTSGTLAVTAATGQTAHKVIGTGTGSSFSPVSLVTGDLPFTYSGNTTELGTVSGALTPTHTIVSDASGNLIDSGTTGGSGTVTSVAMTVPSWLAVTGSPVTGAGTLAVAAATGQTSHKVIGTGTGTSFGVVSLGTADLPFTYSGNTTELATATGTLTNGHCVSIDANGNFVDSGVLGCSGSGGGGVTSVGLAAPTGFGITGSPVTTSGTLTLAMPSGWTTGDMLLGNGSNSVTRLAIGASGTSLQSNGTTASWQTAGTVSSVAQTFTGGLISVGGSPITSTGTLALTVAGTSGGIPYFSSSSAWASSAALTANLPVIGGGAGSAPTVGSVTGNTTKFATSTGALTNGHCVSIDASGNFVDSGVSGCGGGSTGSITVNSGSALTYPVNFANSAAVTGLQIVFTNPSGSNVAAAISGALTNAGLVNSTVTLNGQSISLGASGNVNAGNTIHSIALNEGNGNQIGATATGTSGQPLLSGGSGADPAYGPLNISNSSNITGLVPTANLPLTVMYTNVANTISSGDKLTVTPSSTTSGFNLGSVTVDPSSLAGGDIWFRTDLNQISYYDGSNTQLVMDQNTPVSLAQLNNSVPAVGMIPYVNVGATALSWLTDPANNCYLAAGSSGPFWDSNLCYNTGTGTLTVTGAGGITTAALHLTGPAYITTTIPGGAPALPGASQSALAVNTDGHFYESASNGAFSRFLVASLLTGNTTNVVSGASTIATAPNNDLICGDGSGNVKDCGSASAMLPLATGHLYAGVFGAAADAGTDFTLNTSTHTFAAGSTGIFTLAAASAATGFKVPTATGAAPTADGQVAFNSTTHYLVFGSNGSTRTAASAASSVASAPANDVITADGSGNVQDSGTLLSSLAPLASPALTGTPTAPTPSTGDNSTTVSTTAFVKNQNYALQSKVGAVFQVTASSITGIVGADFAGSMRADHTLTVQNITASAAALATCTTNPTITFLECGTSATCASPTTIGTVTVTAANAIVNGTVSSTTVNSGDYVVGEVTAGACATLSNLSAAMAY